jgi:hypothetical protein
MRLAVTVTARHFEYAKRQQGYDVTVLVLKDFKTGMHTHVSTASPFLLPMLGIVVVDVTTICFSLKIC